MLYEPPSQRAQRLSDRAQLDFGWERFHKIQRELVPLFQRHYDEIAVDKDLVALDPDWEAYLAFDQRNILHILTARARANGKLAGYIFNRVGTHDHYKSTRFAHTEMFYLHPYFRKGWQPVKMFLENIRGLRVLNAEISTINFKLHFHDGRVGKLLARFGYEATDVVMRKVL